MMLLVPDTTKVTVLPTRDRTSLMDVMHDSYSLDLSDAFLRQHGNGKMESDDEHCLLNT